MEVVTYLKLKKKTCRNEYNGCICCNLREDLLVQVRELATEGKFDYLLIESTGISEPLPVATTFDFRDENGASLSDVAKLDTMVTVVDAANLIKNYSSTGFLKDKGESLEDDERTLVDLLVEQIEFANVILLNKIDLISSEELKTVKAIISGLNTEAKVFECSHSTVNLKEVIGTGLFDLKQVYPFVGKRTITLKIMFQKQKSMGLQVLHI